MRITVKIPDNLWRRAKAEAMLRGRKLDDLVTEGLQRVLQQPVLGQPKALSLHDLMRDCCGIAEDTPADYATNPKYMEGFARAADKPRPPPKAKQRPAHKGLVHQVKSRS
jgi:hypothetical protein